jgi:CHASE3 domain sensor protein
MRRITTRTICVCVALALGGCGSSSDEPSTSSPAATKAPATPQDQAASTVCAARADIQTQVETLTSLTADSATKTSVTSALTAITSDLQKIKDAQADLNPERKQQVQDAVTAFGTQLQDIARQAVAGLATTDAETQAKNAAASLKTAVTESLQPIDC